MSNSNEIKKGKNYPSKPKVRDNVNPFDTYSTGSSGGKGPMPEGNTTETKSNIPGYLPYNSDLIPSGDTTQTKYATPKMEGQGPGALPSENQVDTKQEDINQNPLPPARDMTTHEPQTAPEYKPMNKQTTSTSSDQSTSK